MPGEIDRLARNPLSFYGSHKSSNGYCTRQTINRQRNGLRSGLTASSNKLLLYSRMNGRKVKCNRVTHLSSNKIPVNDCKNATELVPRHCRYLNMQVRRRFPQKRLASTSSHGVNDSSLSCISSPTTRRSNGSELSTPLVEKALAKSKESRVLISAELKNKADSEMKNSVVRTRRSTDSASGIRDGGTKANRSAEAKKADETVSERPSDKGVQLHNRRSLPELRGVQTEKSVITVGHQSGGNKNGAKVKKYHAAYRSRSLSPTKPLALSRPRRSAVTKRSVCCKLIRSFEVLIL